MQRENLTCALLDRHVEGDADLHTWRQIGQVMGNADLQIRRSIGKVEGNADLQTRRRIRQVEVETLDGRLGTGQVERNGAH